MKKVKIIFAVLLAVIITLGLQAEIFFLHLSSSPPARILSSKIFSEKEF